MVPRKLLVTGASRGLGRALAIGLTTNETRMVLTARSVGQLNHTAQAVRKRGGEAIVVPADLGNPEDCNEIVKVCDSELAGVDVLINNAAVWEGKPLHEVGLGEIGRIVATNLTGPISLTRLVLDGMRQKQAGHIMVIGSTVGLYCAPRSVVYAATKFGIWGFCRSIRPYCRENNIKVTTVFPGSIASELDIEADEESVRAAHNGKRMPTKDLVNLISTILTMSDMSLVEEVAVPAMKDRYGD